MSVSGEYRIAFLSLKNGIHDYEFDADEAFFSRFEDSFIQNADVKFSVELERLTTLMNLNIGLSGSVNRECDRCRDELLANLEGDFRIVVKFGDETSDVIDDIIVLGPAESHITLDQLFYEFTHLCLAQKNVHESESDCNQKAIEALREFELKEKDEIDPRWEQLKKLK